MKSVGTVDQLVTAVTVSSLLCQRTFQADSNPRPHSCLRPACKITMIVLLHCGRGGGGHVTVDTGEVWPNVFTTPRLLWPLSHWHLTRPQHHHRQQRSWPPPPSPPGLGPGAGRGRGRGHGGRAGGDHWQCAGAGRVCTVCRPPRPRPHWPGTSHQSVVTTGHWCGRWCAEAGPGPSRATSR